MTKRNAVSLLVGVGVVAVCSLAPLTGWLARLELRMLTVTGVQAMIEASKKTTKSANDPVMALANGTQVTLFEEAKRFPDDVALQAAALRFGLEQATPGKRPENYEGSKKPAPTYVLPKDSDVVALLEVAERGARLEPENAYFPACKVAVLLAANRDDEALTALHESATKTAWNEHIPDEIRAKWQQMEQRQGKSPALSRVAISASILYPHYSHLRALARVVQAKAIAKEKAGDLQGGLALRTDLMALGANLRNDAPNLIGNLVGMAIHSIATSRPGGVPRVEREKLRQPGESDEALTARIQVIHDAQWDAYASRLDHPELVGVAAKNTGFRLAIKGRMEKVDHLNPMGLTRILGVMKLEAAGLALLLSALWVVLVGGLCQGLCRTRRIHEGKPLHSGVCAGLWLSFCIVPLIGLLVSRAAGEEILLGVGLATAVLTAGILYFQRRALGAVFLMVIAVYGVLALAIATGYGVLGMLQGFVGGGAELSQATIALLASPLLLTVPLLIVLVLALIGWRRRIPASVAIVRSFPKVALPIMAVLFVLWASVLIPAALEEASLRVGLDEGIQHEGRMFMKLAGEPWPGDK
jgi:hypothetical protein